MKTIEQIKNEVAVKHGYDNWLYISSLREGLYINEVATEYARQMCDENTNVWIDVNVRLPENRKQVIVWVENNYEHALFKHGIFYQVNSLYGKYKPTHWMEMPQPPNVVTTKP